MAGGTRLLAVALLFIPSLAQPGGKAKITAEKSIETQIGYVDVETVIERIPQSRAVQTRLDREFESRDKEMVEMHRKIKELEDRLVRESVEMSENERRIMESDLQARNRRRQEEIELLEDLINDAIVSFGRAEKYDLILTEGVAFAKDSADITQRIIEKMSSE